MKIIKLKLNQQRSYDILVGSNILGLLGRYLRKLGIGKDAYIITNSAVKNRYGKKLNQALTESGFSAKFKLIPDSEEAKSIGMVYSVVKDIAAYDRKRQVFVVAFGGGVIGDLAGFLASIYKRGTAYIQVPTTLLAQVDSSIGGKTAVDLREAKNMLGAFYQPRLVLSDIGLLKTLDLRQVRSGLAEVIKYAVIKDPALFYYLERQYQDILALKQGALQFIVSRCSAIKAAIVGQDEKEEKGIRTILNFGHTIGHAIEAAGGYRGYNHGEAIALGMLVSCGLSKDSGLIGEGIPERIEALIKKVGLPARISRVSLNQIIAAYYHDKKFISAKNRLVLIKGLGRAVVLENIPLGAIKEALRRRLFA